MATTSISITPQFGNNTVTAINCGTSSPRLGGTVDISAFPNLQEFRCNSNDITAISGYANNSNLTFITVLNNKITGSIPSFTGTPNLATAFFNNNLYSGSIPNYNSALRNLQCSINQLTGTIPNFTNNNWLFFQAHTNAGLTGPIPPALSSQSVMVNFIVHKCSLTGTVPNIDNCVAMRRFLLADNNFSGSIPNLSNNVNLQDAWFNHCFFTGAIPNLSNCTSLKQFSCTNQKGVTKLTSFAGGSVSNTLGDFKASNNQLNSTAVNAILAAFVAAGRTSASGTCILNLGGSGNAAPTGQGLTDKATLVSRGWTVTTN